MSESFTWLAFAAGLSGGAVVKVLDIAYLEIRRHFDKQHSAAKFLDAHLDPLLKSADDIVGKLRAHAERDFKDIEDCKEIDYAEKFATVELAGFVYLIASFWAHVELFRQKGLSVQIARDKRGSKLQSFFNSLESRHIRVVDRTTQRAIGEALIHERDRALISFVDFVKNYETDASFRRWLFPLVAVLCQTDSKRIRQRILKFGVVADAMLNTLDPGHHVTKHRPNIANKLSKQTIRDLHFRVFAKHLTFVRNPGDYLKK